MKNDFRPICHLINRVIIVAYCSVQSGYIEHFGKFWNLYIMTIIHINFNNFKHLFSYNKSDVFMMTAI